MSTRRLPILVVDGMSLDDPSKASAPCVFVLLGMKSRGVDIRSFIQLLDATVPEDRTNIPHFIKRIPAISFPGRPNDQLLADQERGFMALWRLLDFAATYAVEHRTVFESVAPSIQQYVPMAIIPTVLGGEDASIRVFMSMKQLKDAGRLPPVPRAPSAPSSSSSSTDEQSALMEEERRELRRLEESAKFSPMSTIYRASTKDLLFQDQSDRILPAVAMSSELALFDNRFETYIGRDGGQERGTEKVTKDQMGDIERKRSEFESEMMTRIGNKRQRLLREGRLSLLREDGRREYEKTLVLPRVQKDIDAHMSSSGTRAAVAQKMDGPFKHL